MRTTTLALGKSWKLIKVSFCLEAEYHFGSHLLKLRGTLCGFYPEEDQAQPCLLNIRAPMLSLLKNQVPGWRDSPQLEPKGSLLAWLGVTGFDDTARE